MCNIEFVSGLLVPIPTLPPSITVNTSALLSNKFNISPLPLWVIIPAVALLLASTCNNSTSLSVVFNVVKSPPTVRFPLISASPFISNPVAVNKPPWIPPPPPVIGPTNLVAVITPTV